MEVSIEHNIKQVTRGLSDFQRKQVPFATSLALNDVAFGLSRKHMPGELDSTFEGGATPYTKRAFKFKKSTKRKLISSIYTDERTHPYMNLMVHGGQRLPKRKAILVPTKHLRKNRYGNVTRGKLQTLINDKQKYFAGKPKGFPGAGEGIWERYGRGNRIRMVAKYEDAAQYSKEFPLQRIGTRYVLSAGVGFEPRFRERMRRALATQRGRG